MKRFLEKNAINGESPIIIHFVANGVCFLSRAPCNWNANQVINFI